ncbi:MAG: OmpA family protein [Devosia sp.]|nr:OmpA family protein [Devosia sp.]
MQHRHRLATALGVGFLLLTPAFVFAQSAPANQPRGHMQKACVDAGITDPAECKTFLEKQKAGAGHAAPDKAAADKAAADKAAADKAAADKAAADKAAADNAAAGKAAADKAAADKAAADKAAADKAAAAAAAAAAAGPKLPRACVAAGITTQQDCDALIAKQKADKAAADQAARDKAAADKAAADKAAADGAAAAAKAGNQPVTNNLPAVETGKPSTHTQKGTPRLPKDCLDAGVTTQADCDALHAINAQKAKGGQTPTNNNAAPASSAPAVVEQPATLPTEVTPAKPGHHQAAEPPATNTAPVLPNIERPLRTAATEYNRAVAALAKAGNDPAAADKAKAEIKAQQAKIDALCKSNQFDSAAQCLAQFGIELAPLPAAAVGGQPPVLQPAQPVEVINNLPKGVTKQEVAPLLDSAKDQQTGKTHTQQGAPPAQVQTETLSNVPPPSNDKAAQVGIKPGKPVSIDQQQGQKLDPNAGAPQLQVPQNVTIINQTVVNNTTNVQNNNGPGTQQNNGAPGSQQAGNDQNGRPGDNRPGGGSPGQPNQLGLGLQVILQLGNQLIVDSPGQDQRRIADHPDDRTFYEQLPNGRYRETITRQDGVRIVTIYNRNGDILRRSRFDRQGNETVLAYFDDRYANDLSTWRDPGEDLPPLRLHIPARDYVLDADQADANQVQDFFAQPPVEQVQRLYSIDEVKRSSRIRDMVRRLEIGDLTFDTGAATISEDQVANLSTVAQAMLTLLDKNPAETFLIEGHTDAVGSDIANLKLSDARAETVAQILTDFYHIPPENLATQGYGERYLKVQTDGPERLNRRVTIRRITPLVTIANQNY